MDHPGVLRAVRESRARAPARLLRRRNLAQRRPGCGPGIGRGGTRIATEAAGAAASRRLPDGLHRPGVVPAVRSRRSTPHRDGAGPRPAPDRRRRAMSGGPQVTWTHPALPMILSMIPEDTDSLVDIGCGRGIVGALCRIYRRPTHLVGVDAYKPYLQFCERLG